MTLLSAECVLFALLAFDYVSCQDHTCWTRPREARKWTSTDSPEYKEYIRNAFRPPLSAGPDNTAAVNGSRVTFHCKSDTVATLNWYFRAFNDQTSPITEIVNNCVVNSEYTDKFELGSTSFGQCDLVIKSVSNADAGTYVCKQQTLDPPGKSAELIVLDPPFCTNDVDTDYIVPGQLVAMSCTVIYRGYFHPEMTWTDEQGFFLPSSSVIAPTHAISRITAIASGSSMGLYNCETRFNRFTAAPPEANVDPATNAPDYTSVWTSSRILVEPGEDCADIKTRIPESRSGVFSILIRGSNVTLQVYCDMTTSGGGWTVFQRRQDGSVDFYMPWESYAFGFGSPSGEHWLGNVYINALSSSQSTSVRFDLGDWEGNYTYAQYEDFVMGPESSNFELSIGAYSGDAGDSMTPHQGFKWTTLDRDNDINDTLNCAQVRQGGWWYRTCGYANLNAPYNGTCLPYYACMFWCDWLGDEYALRFTEIKLRPMGFSNNF